MTALVVLSGCLGAPGAGSAPDRGRSALDATVEAVTVTDGTVVATVAVHNDRPNATAVPLAIRFVENDSFALVGTVQVAAGETETLLVRLPAFDDAPADLTVQVRIDGRIVAERPVASGRPAQDQDRRSASWAAAMRSS